MGTRDIFMSFCLQSICVLSGSSSQPLIDRHCVRCSFHSVCPCPYYLFSSQHQSLMPVSSLPLLLTSTPLPVHLSVLSCSPSLSLCLAAAVETKHCQRLRVIFTNTHTPRAVCQRIHSNRGGVPKVNWGRRGGDFLSCRSP